MPIFIAPCSADIEGTKARIIRFSTNNVIASRHSAGYFQHRILLAPLFIVSLFIVNGAGLAHAQPQLLSDTSIATAGYFQLHWTNVVRQPVELQQSISSDFSDAITLYQGSDNASVLSGLSDAKYYFRIRDGSGEEWSKPINVVVKHHSLYRAWAFFILGAVMFAALLLVLIRGNRSSQQL